MLDAPLDSRASLPTTVPTHETSNLLSLPREIRDMITFHLIKRRTAPPCPPLGPPKRASGTDRTRGVAQFTHPRLQRLPSLARVNRQLHDEVLDLAHQSYRAGKLTPELDIMVKGYSIYSVWTIVPMTIERGVPFNINAKIRVFGTEAFRSSDDHPPLHGEGFRALLKLLNNLLESGPSLQEAETTDENRLPFCIDKLHVNATWNSPNISDSWPQTSLSILRNLKGLATSGIAHPCVKQIGAETTHQKNGEDILIKKRWQVSASTSDQGLQEFRYNGFRLLPDIQEQSDLLTVARLSLGNRDSPSEATSTD